MQLCRACDAVLLYSSGARETSEYMHHIPCNHRGLKFLGWPVFCEAQSCVSTMSSLGPLLSPWIALNRLRSLASAVDWESRIQPRFRHCGKCPGYAAPKRQGGNWKPQNAKLEPGQNSVAVFFHAFFCHFASVSAHLFFV